MELISFNLPSFFRDALGVVGALLVLVLNDEVDLYLFLIEDRRGRIRVLFVLILVLILVLAIALKVTTGAAAFVGEARVGGTNEKDGC